MTAAPHVRAARSFEVAAEGFADRAGGSSDAALPSGVPRDEPSYADFLGEQV